jgi:hypothetical protein
MFLLLFPVRVKGIGAGDFEFFCPVSDLVHFVVHDIF